MDDKANQELLAEATKHIQGCDWIIDMYDLTILWASNKTLEVFGYSMDELLKSRSIDFIGEEIEVIYRQDLPKRMTKRHGEIEYPIFKKDRTKLLTNCEYAIFNFNEGVYIASKILTTKPIVLTKK
jgi:PAS domain-containing protein